jgi:SecD/SecF fusion protein
MKTIKYIILAILMATVTLGSLPSLLAQKGTIAFHETYSGTEIVSRLDPHDRFFHLMEVNVTGPDRSYIGKCSEEGASELWKYIHSEPFLQQLPDDVMFAWGIPFDDQNTPLYALRQPAGNTSEIDHADIQNVEIIRESQRDGYGLQITFTEKGAEKWATLTGSNIGRNIAIVIEGVVYAAPRVQDQIKGGKCLISGNFSKSEITRLRDLLDPSAE